ncbi:MAG TPA: TolC family protein, partial [Polyangiaceae bacterium]|nr:TolC family protein [Polyangiaceae bacterium]
IQASDTLHEAWWTVHADIAKVRAAAARAGAARAALVSARERYEAGAGTQLDALQAVRDAANADVESIQATANLAADRALLRIAAGESLRTGAAVK